MAGRMGADAQSAPPGSILVVIHDFVARSPDELSLSKGDRIELIERDDDFGDGWFLGKHLSNGTTGLFPEVYTRPASKGSNTSGHLASSVTAGPSTDKRATSEDYSVKREPQEGSMSSHRSSAPSVSDSASAITSHNPVMTETLDVIKEHINDMNTPRGSMKAMPPTATNHDLMPPPDIRASYIRGQETDEEENQLHTDEEVSSWSPARVAEYLEDQGVEKKHCEVFLEQEISGEVLLNMEQSSIFIKEFDLGSVGRRLKTWQKVRALQDEVRLGAGAGVPRSVSNYSIGDENAPTEDISGHRRRSSTMTGSSLNAINASMPKQRLGADARSNTTPYLGHSSPQMSSPGLNKSDSINRPSAQTIRTMQHSRRHSSLGSDISMQRAIMPQSSHAGPDPKFSHERTRSSTGFDMSAKRTSRFGHKYNLSGGSHVSQAPQDWGLGPMGSPSDVDRGYFSGNELDKRNRRSVLQKKSISASHSRNPSEATIDGRASYQSGSKVDSPLGGTTGGGMFGKVKGMRSASSPKNFGKTFLKEGSASPVVTRLDYDQKSPGMAGSEASSAGQSPSAGTFSFLNKPRATGLRIASDSGPQSEKSGGTSKPSPLNSPTRTGSTTPSTESHSMDQQKSEKSRLSTGSSQNLGQAANIIQPAPKSRPRARSKKFTSAYTRGLEKKTPLEQIEGSDYSGWMKKKSATLVGTWKPRLFVLRGRRLSYYYNEHDVEEKGLIDISGHRVLPAENDRITGLHAALTGAKSPQSPENAAFQTGASADLATLPEKPGDDGLFIFKLVPPRQGMSKAVNFTKPTVHYFAVSSRTEGRLWMAALMKATIDYDSSGKVTTSYNQPTISLAKAKARKERPPALREDTTDSKKNVKAEDTTTAQRNDSGRGLGIGGLTIDEAQQTAAGAEAEDEPQSAASGPDSLTGSLRRKEAAMFIS